MDTGQPDGPALEPKELEDIVEQLVFELRKRREMFGLFQRGRITVHINRENPSEPIALEFSFKV